MPIYGVEFETFDLLWNKHPIGKYPKTPCFGHTRMVRDRFDLIWWCVKLSEYNKELLYEMTHE